MKELPLVFLMVLRFANLGAATKRVRSIILFIGAAGGIPTPNAAGIHAHDRPQSLFIQSMPHVALADTSALDAWVTDSAAGMSALVTGEKTNNVMVSQLPEEGTALKTILEYAEERGLSTGVVTNMAVWDATPATCYAHAESRKNMAEIFRDALAPRYGDGVDALIWADQIEPFNAVIQSGYDPMAEMQKPRYTFYEKPAEIKAAVNRAISIDDGDDCVPGQERLVFVIINRIEATNRPFIGMEAIEGHLLQLITNREDRAL